MTPTGVAFILPSLPGDAYRRAKWNARFAGWRLQASWAVVKENSWLVDARESPGFPKFSANQRQANMCFHILNVKVSTFGNIWIAYKYRSAQKVCVFKMVAFLSDSDSKFTGFSVEDRRLAEENYATVTQEQIGDISDLDISDFSDDEGENEDPEHDDPVPIQKWDAGQLRRWCHRRHATSYVLGCKHRMAARMERVN